MNVLSWNVQGAVPPQGSPARISSQIEFLSELADCPDLLMLNEVTTDRRDLWREKLESVAGYDEIVDTLDWSRTLGEIEVPPYQDFNGVNGNLTAIHQDSPLENLERRTPSIREPSFDGTGLTHWDTNFPEKILNATADLAGTTIDLWNVRTVPGSMYGEEKIKILENVYERILAGGTRPRILAGDFNAPRDEADDGTIVPWRANRDDALSKRWQEAERNVLSGLDSVGMVDVFRTIHGYGELDVLDISHPTTGGGPLSGKRFDHLLASTNLGPRGCYYDESGLECSDHAPIVARFSPDLSTESIDGSEWLSPGQ